MYSKRGKYLSIQCKKKVRFDKQKLKQKQNKKTVLYRVLLYNFNCSSLINAINHSSIMPIKNIQYHIWFIVILFCRMVYDLSLSFLITWQWTDTLFFIRSGLTERYDAFVFHSRETHRHPTSPRVYRYDNNLL